MLTSRAKEKQQLRPESRQKFRMYVDGLHFAKFKTEFFLFGLYKISVRMRIPAMILSLYSSA